MEVKLNKRKAVTIINDDVSLTFLKPFSEEQNNHLFIIYEDAYGEAICDLMKTDEIILNHNLNKETIESIISELKL
jgi:hypothetical protein